MTAAVLAGSGHTHTVCRHTHPGGAALEGAEAGTGAEGAGARAAAAAAVPEFTAPAFGWGMRPDPGYALAAIDPRTGAVAVGLCPLPDERRVFRCYGALGAAVLLAGAWRLVQLARGKAPSNKTN